MNETALNKKASAWQKTLFLNVNNPIIYLDGCIEFFTNSILLKI